MNLEKILVVVTCISGLIYGYNKLFKKQPNNPIISKPQPTIFNEILDFFGSLFILLLIVLLFRTFVYEIYRIPSGSMKPTLIEGDFILVKKYAYALKLPITHKKLVALRPIERGDVVIFWQAKSGRTIIKRVVGLPGDRVVYKDHKLFVNNNLISNTELGFTYDGSIMVDRKKELLTADLAHEIYVNPLDDRQYQFNDLVVSDGNYFVMGDNRSNSADSRIEGLIAEQDLLGKALVITFSIDFEHWVWRIERFWKKII